MSLAHCVQSGVEDQIDCVVSNKEATTCEGDSRVTVCTSLSYKLRDPVKSFNLKCFMALKARCYYWSSREEPTRTRLKIIAVTLGHPSTPVVEGLRNIKYLRKARMQAWTVVVQARDEN